MREGALGGHLTKLKSGHRDNPVLPSRKTPNQKIEFLCSVEIGYSMQLVVVANLPSLSQVKGI